MFDVIALICALGQAPQECVPQTARDVFKVGEESSDIACMRRAQMGAGSVTLGHIGKDEYFKFECVRRG
jgi:hypothetical protein